MTIDALEERRRQLTSFVQEHSAEGNDALLELISGGHKHLVGSVKDFSVNQASWKPAPEEWSALEAMSHILEVKQGVTKTCLALAQGRPPEPAEEALVAQWLSKGYSGDPLSSPEAAIEAAVAGHAGMAAFVESISEFTDVKKCHSHPLVGPMNCREWAVFQRAHDADHGEQIEKIKAMRGFPGA